MSQLPADDELDAFSDAFDPIEDPASLDDRLARIERKVDVLLERVHPVITVTQAFSALRPSSPMTINLPATITPHPDGHGMDVEEE